MSAERMSEAAAHGFTSKRTRRRQAAEAGWRRRRREGYAPAGRRVAHRRDRQQALDATYRVQQVSRERFEELFAELRARQGVNVSERGLETRWRLYMSCMLLYRAKGQDVLTTNGQRAQGMALRGRPRCTRTIQRARADLAEMGLLRSFHVKRGGARAGRRDCLRLSLSSRSFVTPPTAAGAAALRAANAPASTTSDRQKDATSTARLAPPDGGRGDPAALRPPHGSDKVESDAARDERDRRAPVQESIRQAAREAAARAGLPIPLRSRRRHRRSD